MKSLLSKRSYKDGKTCFMKTCYAFWATGLIILKQCSFFSENDPNGIHDWSATCNPVMMWVQTLHTLFSSFINVLLYRIIFFFMYYTWRWLSDRQPICWLEVCFFVNRLFIYFFVLHCSWSSWTAKVELYGWKVERYFSNRHESQWRRNR